MKTFTVKQACEALHVSGRTLGRYRKSRRIGFFKIGGRVLFTQENIDRAISTFSRKAIA